MSRREPEGVRRCDNPDQAAEIAAMITEVIGKDVEAGLLPNDDALVGSMVKNICYANAKAYLNLVKG
jgi:glucuronate isomerase